MKKLNKKQYLRFIDKVCSWASKANKTDIDQWKLICNTYLKHNGWNLKARRDFFTWGEYGFNNEKLQDDATIDEFYAEVHYASDRMTLDRLFRCHVMYRNLL